MSSKGEIPTGKRVVIDHLVTREDGSIGIGNNEEVSVEEAVELIRAGVAKSPLHTIGVVPAEWGK
jgi:hypothetical protein